MFMILLPPSPGLGSPDSDREGKAAKQEIEIKRKNQQRIKDENWSGESVQVRLFGIPLEIRPARHDIFWCIRGHRGLMTYKREYSLLIRAFSCVSACSVMLLLQILYCRHLYMLKLQCCACLSFWFLSICKNHTLAFPTNSCPLNYDVEKMNYASLIFLV